MTLQNPVYRKLAVDRLCKVLLTADDDRIRIKAATSLGQIGDENAIPCLCEALECSYDRFPVFAAIANAMVAICTHSQKEAIVSEESKRNIRIEQGNYIESSQGDIIHHHAAASPNLKEAAKEIQELLAQLQQSNPNATEEELVKTVIRQHPTLKKRLLEALKAGGTEALKVLLPFLSIPIETVRAFLEAEDDRDL